MTIMSYKKVTPNSLATVATEVMTGGSVHVTSTLSLVKWKAENVTVLANNSPLGGVLCSILNTCSLVYVYTGESNHMLLARDAQAELAIGHVITWRSPYCCTVSVHPSVRDSLL